MKQKIKLSEEIAEFLKTQGHAVFPAYETYGYYKTPWMKLDQGTNVAEVYWGKDFPEDLLDYEIDELLHRLKVLSELGELNKLKESGQLTLWNDEQQIR